MSRSNMSDASRDPRSLLGDALLEVPQHPVDNPELPVRGGRGSGLAQVMADHQTLLKADLTKQSMLCSPSCQIRIFPTHQCILEVAQVPMCVTQTPVGPVLVPQAPSLESQGQELLVEADTLT